MSLTPRLDLRQSQSLTMTPRLQQAIRLLQMTSLELESAVAEELEKNPFLEREDAGYSENEESALPDNLSETEGRDELPDLLDSVNGGREDAADVEEEYLSEDSFYETGTRDDGFDEADFSVDAWSGSGGFENVSGGSGVELCAGKNPSLYEEMQNRILTMFDSDEERRIAFAITENLDESGYLASDFGALDAGCDAETFERILGRLQEAAPTGAYARSLTECFALQLKERDRLDPAMTAFLNHLDLAARREYKKLSEICGVDVSDVLDMYEEIKRLSVRPAAVSGGEVAPAVVPDVLVRRLKNGDLSVVLNQAALPRVLINREYAAEVAMVSGKSREARKFMNESLSSANFLIKALNQRAETILKVATEIVGRQREFFDKGEEGLVPMVLKDVAQSVMLHESTVSRVTSGKYMATPRGVFELKYFFTQGLENSSGESCSSRSVQSRIRALIDGEGLKVLSDDGLAALLKKEGIEIARRTVAKYREAMGIPPSSIRKREKRAGKV